MTTKSNRTEFGKRVLRARKWAGMTQQDLADAIGCRQSNIAEAEHRADASMLTVAIARATGTCPDWLATGQGEMCANSPDSPPVPNISLSDAPEPTDVIRVLAQLLMPLNASRRKAVGSLLLSLSDDPTQWDGIAPDISYLTGGSKTDLSNLFSRPPPAPGQRPSAA